MSLSLRNAVRRTILRGAAMAGAGAAAPTLGAGGPKTLALQNAACSVVNLVLLMIIGLLTLPGQLTSTSGGAARNLDAVASLAGAPCASGSTGGELAAAVAAAMSPGGKVWDHRLAVVVPMTVDDIPRLTENLRGWVAMTPCVPTAATGGDGGDEPKYGLFFLNNGNPKRYGAAPRMEDVIAGDAALAAALAPCVKEVRTLFADLAPHEDGYPEGPSFMFFKLFQEPKLRQEALGGYTHAFWMEWDTRPVRPGWMDKLLATTHDEPFWIKGSHYVGGAAFDSTVLYPDNWPWIGHINGNALYSLHDPEFLNFQRLAIEREPPSHFWKPFDIAMWKTINTFPYSWHLYQSFIDRFKHTRVVRHVGFTISEGDEAAMLATEADTYLVHGNGNSAGTYRYHEKFKGGVPVTNKTIYWNDEVEPSLQVSVMVRTWSGDARYAVFALESARRNLPYALEFVAVTPEADFPLVNKTMPSWVRVVSEPKVLPDDHIQQKYSKLMADTYCKGKYIFHLDSDVVLVKQLQKRDLFLFGRPMLTFDRYENLRELERKSGGKFHNLDRWQIGTQAALNLSVPFEFSRSNDHLYPRPLYAAARRFIERTHGVTFVEFMRSRLGRLTPGKAELWPAERKRLFSDFNFLGAFAYYHMSDALSWVYVGEKQPGVKAQPYAYSVVRPQLTCQGNARLAEESGPETAKKQLDVMRLVARGQAHCSALEAFNY